MATESEKREEFVYKADPFTFVFRELDLIHTDVREIKTEVKTGLDNVNKRLDRSYIIIILNLLGIIAFLVKGFFF